MFGNPVKTGDGYATVTNDKLSKATGKAAGKAGARLEVRSQETGLVALVVAVGLNSRLLREEKDEASLSFDGFVEYSPSFSVLRGLEVFYFQARSGLCGNPPRRSRARHSKTR